MLLKRLFFWVSKDFFHPSWNRYRAPKIKDYPALDYGGGKADLYRRPHSGRLPIILYLHGGIGAGVTKKHRKGICRALAGQGCAVLCPDIVPGTLPNQLNNIALLAAWARKHALTYGFADNSMFFCGDGSGAFLAAAICRALTDNDYAKKVGLQTELPAPSGAVFFSGVYDLPYALGKKAESGSSLRLAKAMQRSYIKKEDIRQSSLDSLLKPVAGLNALFPPVFFAHSPGDIYCQGQGDILRKTLETAGVPFWEFFAVESRSRHCWNLDPATEDALACNTAAGDFINKAKNGNPGYVRFDI